MTPSCSVLLPVHGIAAGKSRLASILDAQARADLNRYLLTHTLDVIEQWCGDLAGCLVVSPCDAALALARDAGAQVLREPAGGDLNAALAFGATYLVSRGATRLLVVACDLPDLSVAALTALNALGVETGNAVLAPDRAGSGTNALLIDARACDIFSFGAGSCKRHLDALARNGYRNVLCERAELAFDLDTPQDHAEWRARRDARIRRGVRQSGCQRIAEAEK